MDGDNILIGVFKAIWTVVKVFIDIIKNMVKIIFDAITGRF